MFINYAHRGASAYAPENTMASFRKALEMRATGIENEDNTEKLLRIQGTQICPKAENVTPAGIELAAAKGLRVRLWGVSDEEIMRRVYPLDTDGMTVNFPDKLRILMEEDRQHTEGGTR